MSIENRAKIAATRMHASINHMRKYPENTPYITHPAAVVQILKGVKGVTPEGFAAAWLHDVVEDVFKGRRAAGITWVLANFGQRVHDLVEMLTDPDYPGVDDPDLKKRPGRDARMQMNREHTALADWEGQTIKLADLIHNTFSIVKYDKDFAVIYLAEKRLLLPMMTKGDRKLWKRAWELAHQKV
jgi:(p)ppGpp synthase/HD superfamily hydrolase